MKPTRFRPDCGGGGAGARCRGALCAKKDIGKIFRLEKRRLIEQIPFVAADREFVRRRPNYQHEVVS